MAPAIVRRARRMPRGLPLGRARPGRGSWMESVVHSIPIRHRAGRLGSRRFLKRANRAARPANAARGTVQLTRRLDTGSCGPRVWPNGMRPEGRGARAWLRRPFGGARPGPEVTVGRLAWCRDGLSSGLVVAEAGGSVASRGLVVATRSGWPVPLRGHCDDCRDTRRPRALEPP